MEMEARRNRLKNQREEQKRKKAEKAAAKVNSLKDEDDSLACIVDLTQEWTRAAE